MWAPLGLTCALLDVAAASACGDDDDDHPVDAGEDGGQHGSDAGADPDGGDVPDAALGDVTVHPDRIDDVLSNPNTGFADFHFGWWCNLPPVDFTPEQCAERASASLPTNHPQPAVAYFRWLWRDLEPAPGEIDFELIDAAIQSANLLAETLAFRVMAIDEGAVGVPDWLLAPPYEIAGQSFDGTFWPDVRDPTFLAEHERFVDALGARYDDHPAMDHVDIGSVGCWGEWNTACLPGESSIIEVYDPADDTARDEVAAAFEQLIDHWVSAFPVTPVVMLGIGGSGDRTTSVFAHALDAGTGWRVDCWGDWGYFSDDWSHQEDLYPDMIAATTAIYPAFGETWQHAPIQLEVCGTMVEWHDRGWTADAPDGIVARTFQWAIDQHAAVLNAKRTEIPIDYVPAVEDLLRRNGYRYVVDSFNHESIVDAGAATTFVSTWSNLGVTPSYTRRTLTYRLRGSDTSRTFASSEDVRAWLPGTWAVVDTVTIPDDLAAGTYDVEVAIVDRAGTDPATEPLPPLWLGIAGRGDDGWYRLSELSVR